MPQSDTAFYSANKNSIQSKTQQKIYLLRLIDRNIFKQNKFASMNLKAVMPI